MASTRILSANKPSRFQICTFYQEIVPQILSANKPSRAPERSRSDVLIFTMFGHQMASTRILSAPNRPELKSALFTKKSCLKSLVRQTVQSSGTKPLRCIFLQCLGTKWRQPESLVRSSDRSKSVTWDRVTDQNRSLEPEWPIKIGKLSLSDRSKSVTWARVTDQNR